MGRHKNQKPRPCKQVSRVLEFDPNRVRPLPGQPRKRFRGIRELCNSIKEVGQSTPGIVTIIKGDKKFDAQLVDGERRLRACKMAGIPFRAEVKRGGASLEDLFAASFAANFGKQDHDPVEIAEALARIKATGKTNKQLADMAGKSQCWVGQHLSLLNLDPVVQAMMIPKDNEEALEDGEIESIENNKHARAHLTFSLALLLVTFSKRRQISLAEKIVKDGMSIAASRRMILNQIKKDGIKVKDHFGRKRRFETLMSVLESFGSRVGVFTDMSESEIANLVLGVEDNTKHQLVQITDKIAEDLSDLAIRIEKHIRVVPTPRTLVQTNTAADPQRLQA